MIKCVILDMDGTIIDSENAYCSIIIDIYKKFGYECTKEFFIETIGIAEEEGAKCLEAHIPNVNAKVEIFDKLAGLYEQRLKNGLVKVKKGFYELIDYLKNNNIKVLLCSSSKYPYINATLNYIGIAQLFDQIVCADDCARVKPYPDVYLKSVEASGYSVDECLAVEDSSAGILSASSAGIKTVYIPDMENVPQENVDKCYVKLDDLSLIIDLLKKENANA